MRPLHARRAVGVMTALLATSLPARAQDPAPAGRLTLATAVERALATHPSIAQARATQDEAEGAIGEAQAAWWPSVRLGGTATQYQEPMIVLPLHDLTARSRPVFDRTSLQGSVAANYLLFDGGARQARVRRARAQRQSTAAGLDATQQALVGRCVAAFLEIRTQQEILAAQDARLTAFSAERQRVERRLAAGRAARVELLRVEAGVARAQADRVRTHEALAVAQSDLARLTGASPEALARQELDAVVLADSALPDREAALRAGTARNAALRRAQAAAAGSTDGASLARSARWPELRAQGVYAGWSDANGNDALEWNAGLLLSYPLFTGGATRRAVERADAMRRSAEAEQRTVELQVAQDADRAFARVVETHALARSLAVAVDRSAEVARIERLSLDAGSGTQTDYLRAEADLLEVRSGLAQARHGEIAARAELARIAGELDSQWIARNLEARP